MADVGLIPDGAQDFLGGQDASKIPDRIAENCYYEGINVSVKRGALQPRWGFERKELIFPEETFTDIYHRERGYREVFEAGKFQALIPYYIGQQEYFIIVVSGIIFLYNPRTSAISIISIKDGSHLNSRARRINWTAAGKYVVLFDFPAFPVIIDGTLARRANPANYEIPPSVLGAFNQNRLFICNQGEEFTGGDPVGSTATPNAPITFEEIELSGSPYYGQIFKLPTADHNEPITYMGFLQVSDTSTGIGSLIVGTSNSVYSYNTYLPRTSWEADTTNSTYRYSPFGSMTCYNAGIVGPRAFINVNGDAFFLSSDGYVRSLSMSRDEQKTWARIPISREVEPWFKYWDQSLISLGFVSYFKNKIFFSVNPYRVRANDFKTGLPISDYAHGGLAVLELDSLTSYGQAVKPVWAGLWTGIRPMDMATIGDRAFVISKDSSNVSRIYEVNPNINYDTAGNHIRYVRSRVRTRELDFKDPFANKALHTLDFNFDTIEGDFNVKAKYKASHSPFFIPWVDYTHYAPWRTCSIPAGCFLNGYAAHHIRDFTFGAPTTDPGSAITGDVLEVFRKVQLELTLTGKYWELHEFRVKAAPLQQNNNQTLNESLPIVEICDFCSDDWLVAEFESCDKLVT